MNAILKLAIALYVAAFAGAGIVSLSTDQDYIDLICSNKEFLKILLYLSICFAILIAGNIICSSIKVSPIICRIYTVIFPFVFIYVGTGGAPVDWITANENDADHLIDTALHALPSIDLYLLFAGTVVFLIAIGGCFRNDAPAGRGSAGVKENK